MRPPTRTPDTGSIVIGELLAYALGRAHGRDSERRRQTALHPVEPLPSGPIEIVCVILIIIAVLIVLALAIAAMF